jgi:hypothetical protein
MQTRTGHKHRTIPELSIARLASHTRPAIINIDFQFERVLLIDITGMHISSMINTATSGFPANGSHVDNPANLSFILSHISNLTERTTGTYRHGTRSCCSIWRWAPTLWWLNPGNSFTTQIYLVLAPHLLERFPQSFPPKILHEFPSDMLCITEAAELFSNMKTREDVLVREARVPRLLSYTLWCKLFQSSFKISSKK